MTRTMLVLIFSWLAATTAMAQNRTALVIGNAAYKKKPLLNPVNDARAMAKALAELGFEVAIHLDCDQDKMEQAVGRFYRRLQTRKGVALFYYAGHGVQVQEINYLIPLGGENIASRHAQSKAVNISTILNKMQEAGAVTNILILDACRDNSLARNLGEASGFAKMSAPVGSLLVFATSSGGIAEDGVGKTNGIFTGCLLKHIKTPGLAINAMLLQVRKEVYNDTDKRQLPCTYSSLIDSFYFSPADQRWLWIFLGFLLLLIISFCLGLKPTAKEPNKLVSGFGNFDFWQETTNLEEWIQDLIRKQDGGIEYMVKPGDIRFRADDGLMQILRQNQDKDPEACFTLGEIFYQGLLGKPEYDEARKYYYRALAFADINQETTKKVKQKLAIMYYQGDGCHKDHQQALRIFREVAG